MIGSANREYIPCILSGTYHVGAISVLGNRIDNINGTDFNVYFTLPLPTNRGGKKLYIDALKYLTQDADDLNYINTVRVYGAVGTATTVIFENLTDRKTVSDWTEPITAMDVSSYHFVYVFITTVVATAGALGFTMPLLRCYYA